MRLHLKGNDDAPLSAVRIEEDAISDTGVAMTREASLRIELLAYIDFCRRTLTNTMMRLTIRTSTEIAEVSTFTTMTTWLSLGKRMMKKKRKGILMKRTNRPASIRCVRGS